MIINILNTASSSMEKASNLKDQSAKARLISEEAEKLLFSCNDIEKCLDSVYFIKHYDLLKINVDASMNRKICNQLMDCKTKLQEQALLSADIRKLDTLVTALKKDLLKQWKTEVEKSVSEICSIMTIYSRINKSIQNEQLISALIKASQKLPQTAKAVEQFSNNVTAAKDKLQQLNIDNSEVKAFLYKLSENKATIADITCSVRGWLKEQNLEKQFKVSIS